MQIEIDAADQLAAAPALPTFKVYGYVKTSHSPRDAAFDNRVLGGTTFHDVIQGVRVEAETDTPETARAIVATFPKSWRVKAQEMLPQAGRKVGLIYMEIRLHADGVNGGANESGLKRFRALAARVPHEVVTGQYYNSASIRQINDLLAGKRDA